jgi:TolA-binding protein
MNDKGGRPNPIKSWHAHPGHDSRAGRPCHLFKVLLCLAGVTATAIGCGWMGTSHSVRFNDYQTEREMGRLPPLPTMANGLNDARAYWDNESGESEDDYTLGEKRTKDVDGLWERAEKAEQDGNLRLDRDLLRQYLERTGIALNWFYPKDSQKRRNSAFDRLDTLSALDHGASASRIQAYLDARRAHDAEKPVAEEIEHELTAIESDSNLKDNVAYLRAAELYRQNEFEEAAAAFGALARQFPRSERREAALLMAAVATMKTSVTYIPASGNSDYGEDNASKVSADQAWHDAYSAFQRVIAECPRGRYFNEARGWLAYLLLRNHDRAGALVQYYRLLADKHDENARIEATFSLTLVRSSATDDEMERVEKDLANEPEAALAYAYHNIYNYSIDPDDSSPPYAEIKDAEGNYDYEASRRRDDELEHEWKKNRASISHKELLRTLDFSRRLIASYPNLSVGGGFALRAAQASEELDDNQAAVEFAQRALQSRLSGDERAQALWTLGVAEHRLKHLEGARKNFTTLVRDYPRGRLTEGARRELAMIAEDAGDIDGALEQYVALDYSIDVAYFVDVLMTTEQLAGFIQRHPDSPKANEFTYALGVRYLRTNRWDDARNTLARVRTEGAPNSSVYSMGSNCNGDAQTNCVDPKDGDSDVNGRPIITPRLVMRDIQTANDLQALELAVNQHDGDEARAEALYQYASYQYEASSLLLYNPLATPGYWNLGLLASEGRYRIPNESQILWRATQEHERLARALNIYLETVDRFPRTRAARDSLYTAAVCHERLSNYNPYWREIYQNGLHAGQRMVTYADVKAAYPNYQLPRGTYGWQPSTRTVNGGPGWAAAPKPAPRVTKRERLKMFIDGFRDRLTSFWDEKGRRWLTEVMILAGLFFTARIASRNRRRLRARMARKRIEQSRQVVTYPWFEMFWIDPIKPGRREQLRKFLGEKRQEIIELARDHRSRPVLVRSLVSHSVLATLSLSLLWTVWFG